MTRCILFLALASCASTPYAPQVYAAVCNGQIAVKVDAIVADPYTPVMVRDAIKFWNRRIGREVLVYGGRRVMFDHEKHPPYVAVRTAPLWETEKWPEDTIGVHRPTLSLRKGPAGPVVCLSGGLILLRDRSSSHSYDKRAGLVIHELGHALGLSRHSLVYFSLMYKNGYSARVCRIADDTQADLETLYGRPITTEEP